MTQIEDIRYGYTGTPPRPAPLVPFPSPPMDGRVATPEPAPERVVNGTASFALVMSLLWLFGAGALLGVVLGIVAAWQCHRTGAPGRGEAIAAIPLGLVGLVLSPPLLAVL